MSCEGGCEDSRSAAATGDDEAGEGHHAGGAGSGNDLEAQVIDGVVVALGDAAGVPDLDGDGAVDTAVELEGALLPDAQAGAVIIQGGRRREGRADDGCAVGEDSPFKLGDGVGEEAGEPA
jgi:hypothetical protein